MRLTREQAEGKSQPWYRGVAYEEFMTCTIVFYPIPLNFLARWWRDLDYWIHTVGDSGYRSRHEKLMYELGRLDAWKNMERYIDESFLESRMQEIINLRVRRDVEKILSLKN